MNVDYTNKAPDISLVRHSKKKLDKASERFSSNKYFIFPGFCGVRVRFREPGFFIRSQFRQARRRPLMAATRLFAQCPTQILADLLTIHREKETFENLTIGLCGDLKFGRTVHPLSRVNEITVAMDDNPRACYFKQVLNGKLMRSALILKLLKEAGE